MPAVRIPAVISLFLALSLFFPMDGAHAAGREKYKKTVEKYAVPAVTLVNQDGRRVDLRSLLNSRKVVMVDFIFTTCTTICPVLSAGFASFQKRIGPEAEDVQLVSISIDPEHDTPQRMKDYLKRFNGGPGWDFLTGKTADIGKVLVAFQANTSANKIYHLPLALLHSTDNGTWVRIHGLIGTSDLLAEYRELIGR